MEQQNQQAPAVQAPTEQQSPEAPSTGPLIPEPILAPLCGTPIRPEANCPPRPTLALLYGVPMPTQMSSLEPGGPCPDIPLMTGQLTPGMEPPPIRPLYGVAIPPGASIPMPSPGMPGPEIRPLYGIAMPDKVDAVQPAGAPTAPATEPSPPQG